MLRLVDSDGNQVVVYLNIGRPKEMRRSYTGIDLPSESVELLALTREFSEDCLRSTAGERDLNEDVFDGAIHRQLGELGFLGMRS
jgi:hypothetical protein